MMYVEFMKNFLLPDSSELMAVRLILASWAQNKWFPLCRHDVRRVHEKFSSTWFERADGLLDSFWHPEPKNKWKRLKNSSPIRAIFLHILSRKTSDSYFVDMMYVEFMKNFLLADSSELMAVGLILASWAQKQVIPTL